MVIESDEINLSDEKNRSAILSKKDCVLFCYASQKGNAESITEDIYSQCYENSIEGDLSCISEIQSLDILEKYSCIVFVGSTTGDGDPPDTAQNFMNEVKKLVQEQIDLSWVNYTILGLGDTNYTNFCNFGKSLHKNLQLLKCQNFYDCGWADDGTGLEIVVEPWIEGLFTAIKNCLKNITKKNHIEKRSPKTVHHNTDSSAIVNMDALSRQKDQLPISSVFPSFTFLSDEDIEKTQLKELKLSPDDPLSLPARSPSYLLVEHLKDKIEMPSENEEVPMSYPLAASKVISTQLTSFRRLSSKDAAKKTLEISLQTSSDLDYAYEPGDSFGIIVRNSEREVSLLLHLLSASEVAESVVQLKLDPNTTKKGAKLPNYIPKNITLRQILRDCIDFRAVPKKLFIRTLVEYTHDSTEKRRLQELCSKEGTDEYNKHVRGGNLSFIDLLVIFRSCQPSIGIVLENLPKLLPRPYSITSSPLKNSNVISFAFNVIDVPKGGGVTFDRKGICTGWLEDLVTSKSSTELSVEKSLKTLSLKSESVEENSAIVLIYFRSNQNFRLPKDPTIPIIMVGPGTGVAPFIGFLKYREELQMKSEIKLGYSWLFFGCRNKTKDFLFEEDLRYLCNNDLIGKLSVCFSRDEDESQKPKYVQDNIRLNGEELCQLIKEECAIVYVCGDAKNMSKNVYETFLEIFVSHLQLTDTEARQYLAQLQIQNRYLQDVWA